MERVAAALGCRVQWVHPLEVPEDFRGACRPKTRTIFVARSSYQPRNEFSQAHEIAELHIPRAVRELPAALKERYCNRVAAALLLPREQFLACIRSSDWNLPGLRRRWPLASWGAIASRLADLVPGVAACTWVGSVRASWHIGAGVRIPEIISAESAAAFAVQAGSARIIVRRGRATARGWRLTAKQGRKVALTVTEVASPRA